MRVRGQALELLGQKVAIPRGERLVSRSKVAALSLEFLESQARTGADPPAAVLSVKLDSVGPARVPGVTNRPVPIVCPRQVDALRWPIQKFPHHPLDPVGC